MRTRRILSIALENEVEAAEVPAVEPAARSAEELVRRAQIRSAGGNPDDPEAGAAVATTAEVAPAADPEMAEIAETGEETEALVDDAGEHEELVEQADGEMDQAGAAHETLSRLGEVAATAAENGGLSDDGAEALRVATEGIYISLGLEKPTLPAMEAYGDKKNVNARVQYTVAMEASIVDTAKRVWDAIVATFKKAWEWIVSIYKRYLTANGRMKARAEAIQKKLGKDGVVPAGEAIKNAKLAKAVTIAGKAVDVAQQLGAVNTFAKETFSGRTTESLKAATAACKSFQKAGTMKEGGKEFTREELNTIYEAVQNSAGVVNMRPGKVEGAGEPATGTERRVSPAFLGDLVVWADVPTDVASLASFQTGIATVSEEAVEEVPAAAGPQIDKICSEVIAYTAIADEYKKVYAEVEKTAKEVIGVASKMSATAERDTGTISAMRTGFFATRRLMKGVHQPALSLAATVNSRALDYAAASLAAGSKAAKAATK